MPGPGKKNKAKKKPPGPSQSGGQSAPPRSAESLAQDIADAHGWDICARLLCDFANIPDLSTRNGLKRVHGNFDVLFERLDNIYHAYEENPKIVGAVIMVWSKMCNDYLLRDKLFKKDFLSRVYPLLDNSETAQLGMRSLASMTHMGGMSFSKAIATETPRMTKLLEDHPDDLKLAELVIATLSHCVPAITDVDTPDSAVLKSLKIADMLRAVMKALKLPGASGYMLGHAHELLVNVCFHCEKEVRESGSIDFLVAFSRSENIGIRGAALRGTLRLIGSHAVPEQGNIADPMAALAGLSKPWPPEVNRVLQEYGLQRCDTTARLEGMRDFQKAMMQYAQDYRQRDLYTLGRTIGALILKTEYSVVDGFFGTERDSSVPEDLGLGFVRWTDALPLCAKAVRQKGMAGDRDLADVLDCKFYVLRGRLPDAFRVAQRAIDRNPDYAYFYYVMSLSAEHKTSLRFAKRGQKCKTQLTPFIKYALLHRSVDHAVYLAIESLASARVGDRTWKEGVAFLRSGIEDCRIYIAQAPPDQRQMKTVLNQYILLSPMARGPGIDEDMSQLDEYVKKLHIAEACCRHVGLPVADFEMRLGAQMLIKHWKSAAQNWGWAVRKVDVEEDTPMDDVAAPEVIDAFDAWVAEVQPPQDPKDVLEDICNHPRLGGHHAKMYRCANCGNPSAALRKCSGCGRVRYCDNECQTTHWPEHKATCRAD